MSVYTIGGKVGDIFYSYDIWKLARFMHDEYEKIAKEKGWQTQKQCRVIFEDLPEKNKVTMLELVSRALVHLEIMDVGMLDEDTESTGEGRKEAEE